MTKRLVVIILFILFSSKAFGEDQVAATQNQLFYKAGTYYSDRDYAKALQQYNQILTMGLGSGNFYYNTGNSFFKLGKFGSAILFYEKAKRLMPQDSDLKANLSYAKSITGNETFQRPLVIKIIEKPFEGYNLNTLALMAAALYLAVILISVVCIINPILAKKFMFIYIILIAALVYALSAFGLRYYDEEILKHGVVIVKEIEAKYEPIDKSTTYYTLREGDDVVVLNTRNGWRQVARPDGKIAWVNKDAVEET